MRETSEDSSDDESVSQDDDILHDAVHHSEARPATEYFTIPAEMYNADFDVDMELDEETKHSDDEQLTPIQLILQRSITTSVLPPDDTHGLLASPNTITRREVSSFLACDHIDPEEPSVSSVPSTNGHTTVTIELFEHAIRDVSYNSTTPVPVRLDAYASINDVSAFFTLNARQHAAFALVAVPLLAKISGQQVPTANSQLFDSKPLIITGAGGSGKSQIIEAIRALCSSWRRPTAVAVVASTGIAAASQRGATMHSSVGLDINLSHLPKHIESPTDALLQQWAPILCVVADEVSMTDLAFFGLWEEALRHVKDDLDHAYGGLLAVFMFDHCQLRTVRGMPLFKISNGVTSLTPAQERGRQLYRGIVKVVNLEDNMRFVQDPEWGEWLQSGRLGNWKPPLRRFINSLPIIDPHQSIPHRGVIQTISTDNATRTSINNAAIQTAVKCLANGRNIYVIAARLSRRTSPAEMELIRQLPDNKTGNIPVFLQLYIGMPVRVKANQCIAKGVANGASGVVHHVDWFPDTTFELQQNGAWLASNQPMNVYLALSNCSSTLRFPGLPSHWPASVMPIYQATATVTLPGPRLSIKGYPIVSAFGTTVHGVQGETRDAVVITQLRPPNVRQVDSHALYVALSRIRTRQGLYWIGPRPTDGDYDFFRPSAEVLLEDERLKHLSSVTLAAFSGRTP